MNNCQSNDQTETGALSVLYPRAIKPNQNGYDYIKNPFARYAFMSFLARRTGPYHCEESLERFWSGIEFVVQDLQQKYTEKFLNTCWMTSNKIGLLHAPKYIDLRRRGLGADDAFGRYKL
ncbi:uncharacterized protein MELLADRAFT_111222 [Melampsora larici-populina 98AG31]|uniref:Uncharacterized protein n=1 Tax=Melampsora larici-populina (strain 98AG31 / pathotype 3-4-7) TaxID=747676 RepID=F4S2F6_MELLP|nr:uncharacterized protein MELLADRAFT_111222 [Melampsora larici-populina 98AG31]EGG01167.1 hypothetical protein MELLADRAFT_111222 [Melampsora larici-populina 98AG31]